MARKRDAKAVDRGKTVEQPTPKRRSTRVRVSAGAALYDAAVAEHPKKLSSPKKMSTNGVRKGAARRRRPKKTWTEEFVTTNAKSPLVNVDLVKLFANPNSWTCLDEDEKQEILDLLPDHIRPAADPEAERPVIPPLSQEFLRYSNNWRDGIRQYQLDLGQGKYDPEWLRQAAQAMEERAAGKFDKWKEQEFEQFWGQKQNLSHGVIAGNSHTVRLMTLVKDNLIKVGDVWKFTRVFKHEGGFLHIEKEIKIIGKAEKSLTFAIPPGSRVFLSGNHDYDDATVPSKYKPTTIKSRLRTRQTEGTETLKQATSDDAAMDETKPRAADGNSIARARDSPVKSDPLLNLAPDILELLSEDSDLSTPPSSPVAPASPTWPSTETTSNASKTRRRDSGGSRSNNPLISDNEDENALEVDRRSPNTESPSVTANLQEAGQDKDVSTTINSLPGSIPSRQSKNEPRLSNTDIPKDIILKNISSLQALVNKILAIDGRITDPPNGNAWKEFRCYRSNQDIGSPWEIRQEWWVRHPELHPDE